MITLNAAFKGDNDYESLGLDQDWDDVDWTPIEVNPKSIDLMYENKQGNTNIIINSEKWTVRETVFEIKNMM